MASGIRLTWRGLKLATGIRASAPTTGLRRTAREDRLDRFKRRWYTAGVGRLLLAGTLRSAPPR